MGRASNLVAKISSWSEDDWVLLRHHYPKEVERFAALLRDGPPRESERPEDPTPPTEGPAPTYDTADLTAEVARLRDALLDTRRESRDATRASAGVPVSQAVVVDLCAALAKIARRCDDALRDRPDLVLVLRPAEPKTADVEPPPDKADLCKLRDGTWVYRNHAGTWQGCPPPFAPGEVPDDGLTYFRKTQDGTWQTYHHQSRLWCLTLGRPEVAGWTYEAEQLKAELRLARDQYCNNRGDMSAEEALEAIDKLVTNALGDRP